MIIVTTILIQLLVLIAAAPLDLDKDSLNGTTHSHQARQMGGKNVPLYIIGTAADGRFPGVQVNVGGEAYNVLFDTASKTSLMFDKTVKGMSTSALKGRRLYDATGAKSQSTKQKTEFAADLYHGPWTRDTWALDPSGKNKLQADFLKITEVRKISMPVGFSGLLGFAPYVKFSVMGKLSPAWSAKEFGVHLTPRGGQLTVGGHNPDCIATGERLEYVPIVHKYKWIVEARLAVGPNKFNTKVHLDTGGSFNTLHGPKPEVDALHAEMGYNPQTKQVPCLGTAQMVLIFDGKVKITIPYSDLVKKTGSVCTTALRAKSAGVDYWSIGMPLFQHIYASFKLPALNAAGATTKNAMVGIAKAGARGSCKSPGHLPPLPPMSAAKPPSKPQPSGSGSGSSTNKPPSTGSSSPNKKRPSSSGPGGPQSNRQSSPGVSANKVARPNSPSRQGTTSPGSPSRKKKKP